MLHGHTHKQHYWINIYDLRYTIHVGDAAYSIKQIWVPQNDNIRYLYFNNTYDGCFIQLLWIEARECSRYSMIMMAVTLSVNHFFSFHQWPPEGLALPIRQHLTLGIQVFSFNILKLGQKRMLFLKTTYSDFHSFFFCMKIDIFWFKSLKFVAKDLIDLSHKCGCS